MTALFVPRSPPHSSAFIAVVVGCRWNPLSSLSEVLSLPVAEVSSRFLIVWLEAKSDIERLAR